MAKQIRSELSDKFVTNLDWNLLRTFVIIVEEGGISAAALRLLRRQPTISLALNRLESHIGKRLIDRGGGTFRLTPPGRELYKECIDIYGGISHLQGIGGEDTHAFTGTIDISLASHVVTPILDDLLARFHEQHPQVLFRITVDSSSDVARKVHDKSASLGICLLNKRLKKLEYRVIYREYFGFFCGPPHPLFGRGKLRVRDMRDYAAVSFGTDDLGDALRPVALYRQKHGLDQNIIGQSPHLEEVRRMVLCGIGIGPLPLHVVGRDLRDGLLWRLPPYNTPPAVDIHLVTNPGKRHSRAEAAFISELGKAISERPLRDRAYKG
jgi:DNA-binding transcriptional LysR family regulator